MRGFVYYVQNSRKATNRKNWVLYISQTPKVSFSSFFNIFSLIRSFLRESKIAACSYVQDQFWQNREEKESGLSNPGTPFTAIPEAPFFE